MLEKTKSYYQQKVEQVISYIRQNPGSDLSISTLAGMAAISPFHFHRIMTAALGESPGSYISRYRLETALTLIRHTDRQLADIACEIGFNDLSAFSKAFTKEFGLPPNDYRANSHLVLNTHVDYKKNPRTGFTADIRPKIIALGSKQAASLRVKGEYGGPATYEGWAELEAYAATHKLIGWNPDFFTLYYDDPDEVGHEACQSDLCIATRKSPPETNRIKLTTIEGGLFVAFRYKGSYEHLPLLYETIYRDWVIPNNYRLRNRPLMEKYLNYSAGIKPENLITEVYLPVDGPEWQKM